ncbi:MAG: hypothetical protein ISN28_01535 [Ectothiorhodospiraceae bacterium AqS1]|nr:hypothetical protein [Ectothiorhodospiraceae bacterium AqS1]
MEDPDDQPTIRRVKKLGTFTGVLEASISLLLILGAGAGGTWWAIQRLGEIMKKEVNHMDRLQSIENRMATKEDLSNMVRKEDLSNMVRKEDLSNMVRKEDLSNMATKEDLCNMVTKEELANMITKKDMAVLLDAINKRNERDGQG